MLLRNDVTVEVVLISASGATVYERAMNLYRFSAN